MNIVPMYITLRRTFDFSNVILLWIVFSIVFIALIFFFRYMNLKSRKYLFYNKEAVFYEGFLNIVQRTIPYEKVTDYILHKSVWDRMFGTGTIRLVTAGHLGGYGTHTVGGGVSIQYIENPDEVYNKLKSIIKNK